MATKRKSTETPAPVVEAAAPEPVVISYKGFDQSLSCRGFQFEIGKTYEHNGKVAACESGFHACANPLDVFGYYPPGTSRFAIVTQGGKLGRHDSDTKIASARITIDAELNLPDVIARAVKWVIDHATGEAGKHVEGYQSAASSTGDRSAASSTGDRSAASSTGDQSAASSTGDRSAAMASGHEGRVQGAKGCALFLVYRNSDDGEILHAWAGIAGRDGIKPLTFYTLGADGKPVEVVS